MRIDYYGKNEYYKNRCAIISYDEEKENILNDRIVDYLEKMEGYKISCEIGCTIIEVSDKEDYQDLVSIYKTVKKMFKNCLKYGF